MPSMFRQSGCTEGKPPNPISVGLTGNCNSSAKARSASAAPELTMPPPTYITGRSAFMIAAAASATARESGGHLRSTRGKLMFFRLEYEVRAADTSFAMSITIGPACSRQVKTFVDYRRQIADVAHQVVVLNA